MNTSRGFTLVEVLVAVLILAIGLLGLAALQLQGLKNNHNAYLRAQATQLAYDISDRMRANASGVTAGHYNNQAATADNCVTGACTIAQMAGYDLAQWNTALTAGLPDGEGIVCTDNSTPDGGTPDAPSCDGGSVYAIKIWWNEYERGSGTVVQKRFVTSFQP